MVQFGKDEEIFSPLIDLVFKSIFTRNNSNSKGALIDFLESIVGGKIEDVNVVGNELPVGGPEEKSSVMDIHCRFSSGDQANIEVQLRPWGNLCARAEYYVSKLHCAQPLRGLDYDDVKYTYQITIVDYPVLPKRKGFFTKYEYKDPEGDPLPDGRTRIFFLELTKLQKILEKPMEELTKPEKWALYLKYANDQGRRPMINQLIEKEEGLEMASNILQQITRDDHLRAAIFSREKAENDRQAREVHSRKIGWQEGLNVGRQEGLSEGIYKGRQEGLSEGLQKGFEKAMEEMVQRLQQTGMSLSDISGVTNLSLDQLKKLLNS